MSTRAAAGNRPFRLPPTRHGASMPIATIAQAAGSAPDVRRKCGACDDGAPAEAASLSPRAAAGSTLAGSSRGRQVPAQS